MDILSGFIFSTFPGGRIGWALLIVRVFAGAAFLRHGRGKLRRIDAFCAQYGLPHAWGLAAALSDLVVAPLLIVGLLTPIAALVLAVLMAVATVILIRQGEPFISPVGHSWEAAALYFVLGIALALTGAGRYSVDALIFGR